MLKASLRDIPILDGYLHDAYFRPEDILFDPESRSCTVELERLYYERAEIAKFLWVIPFVRCPSIQSRLTMTGVDRRDETWHDNGVDGPDGKHLLLGIKQLSENSIELESPHFEIILTIDPDFGITLVDESESDKKKGAVFLFRCTLFDIDEIERLKVNAQQGADSNEQSFVP
jgi:hypothetical protein